MQKIWILQVLIEICQKFQNLQQNHFLHRHMLLTVTDKWATGQLSVHVCATLETAQMAGAALAGDVLPANGGARECAASCNRTRRQR
jgi:hypothetical protein